MGNQVIFTFKIFEEMLFGLDSTYRDHTLHSLWVYLYGHEFVKCIGGYDVIEIAGWLTISLLITFVMLLQNRGIYQSAWIRGADRLQYVVYAIIACTAFYWSFYGYYMYTWDILLWIGGFAIIDANLAGWREELKEESEMTGREQAQGEPV